MFDETNDNVEMVDDVTSILPNMTLYRKYLFKGINFLIDMLGKDIEKDGLSAMFIIMESSLMNKKDTKGDKNGKKDDHILQ